MNLRHPLILASNSPRRQQMLREAGFVFKVYTEEVDESYPEGLAAGEVAEFLARKKNQHYCNVISDSIILSADTTVILGEEVLNKPADEAEACRMLEALSGNTHLVATGVCISFGGALESFTSFTKVTFRQLSANEIEHYVRQYKPLDKAGAYGIQEWIGMVGITQIEGSYLNVVGLPVQAVYSRLTKYLA